MAALLAALAILAQDGVDERVEARVAELRSEALEAREAAAAALVELGEPALARIRALVSSEKDADVQARLKEVAARIERAAARARVCRPARTVTLSAEDRPLGEVVREACAQAGVECVVDDAIADRRVRVSAERQPLMQVLDGLGGADTAWEVREGRVRFVKEKHAASPTAYAEGFRLRLKRVQLFHTNEFARSSSAVVLNLIPDAEPGVAFRGATLTVTARGAGGEEIALKSAADGRMTGSITMGERGWFFIDEVPVAWDAEYPLETALMAKDLPGGLERLASVTAKVKFRFATATRPVTLKMRANARETIEGTSLRLFNMGGGVQLESTDGTPVAALADLDSVKMVGPDGAETTLRRHSRSPSSVYFYAQEMRGAPGEMEFRLTVMADVFEREATFELKEVDLRPR